MIATSRSLMPKAGQGRLGNEMTTARRVFIDTSALLAVLDADDANHQAARPFWESILAAGDNLISHNYILMETSALVLRKLGLEALRVLERDIVPILCVIWVTQDIHHSAAGAQIIASRRSLSLVDCVSFEIMRQSGIRAAFSFDRHLKEHGYEVMPS
jgi:predicted nucleic acid-binding protein